MGVGETAEEEVHLTDAAMPRTEAEPLAADSEGVVGIAHGGSQIAHRAGPIFSPSLQSPCI
jgi:hypothetical protein